MCYVERTATWRLEVDACSWQMGWRRSNLQGCSRISRNLRSMNLVGSAPGWKMTRPARLIVLGAPGVKSPSSSADESWDVEGTVGPSQSSEDELVPAHLPASPDLQGKAGRSRWNATHFAFLGDAVWELHMRRHFFHPPTRNSVYSSNVAQEAKAEAQAAYLGQLVADGVLAEDELDVVRWARNAKLQNFPKRFKASDRDIYKNASCFEALVGFLYVTSPERLNTVMRHLGFLEQEPQEDGATAETVTAD